MLVPFERNFTYISKFNASYIPTFLNDLFNFEKIPGGLMICVSNEKTGYILFKDSKVISVNGFYFSAGNELSGNIPFSVICDSSNLDVYINVIEDSRTIDVLSGFLNSAVTFAAPFELSDIKRITGMIEAEKETGILGFKHGSVMNMATYNNGALEAFFYYHPGTRSYALDTNPATFGSYLLSVDKLKPFVVYKRCPAGDIPHSDKHEIEFLKNDPLLAMTMAYIDVFELICKALKEKLDVLKIVEVFDQLLKILRDKYSPLYTTISYSLETGCVNWVDLFKERRYISMEYRFGEYHLYLDELLRIMLKISSSALGSRINEKLIPGIKKYIEFMDKKDFIMKEMAHRVDKMVEKVK